MLARASVLRTALLLLLFPAKPEGFAGRSQDTGRVNWRCSSFRGERGIPVEGRMFTPPPTALWSKALDSSRRRYFREKQRKLPAPRQMLCTDIQVQTKDAEKAFMRAWNLIVGHRMRYAVSFRETARDDKDALVRYRAGEMARLQEERSRLMESDYVLSRKVLDHIEVTADGKLAVIFLTGTRVTV